MAYAAHRSPMLVLALERLTLGVLALTLLLMGFTGHLGVQVLDNATAARIFALHLHGVPGEAEYVHTHGAPAPFVAPHCHEPLPSATGEPSPDEVQAAALAGATLCTVWSALPISPAPGLRLDMDGGLTPDALSLLPLVPPPQA
jgi:hypothetical protein